MIAFLLRRLLYGILVMLGIALVVFFLFMILPDPARLTLGQRADEETLTAVREDLGLDEPWYVRLGLFLNDLSPVSVHETEALPDYDYVQVAEFPGEHVLVLKWPYLRKSYQSKREVWELLLEALPKTLLLALSSLLLAVLIGIPMGVWSALRRFSVQDNVILVIAILGISIPSFFSGIIISWLGGFEWQWTGLPMFGSLYEYTVSGPELALENLILPALTLGIRPLAIVTQLTRSSMLEVLGQDYIRTAVAKGLNERVTVLKHALRNALNPVLTAVSGWLASLMAGAFFVEFIFNWKGIGLLTVQALETADFPVVMGVVLLMGFLFVIINIFVDVLYGVLDPRVRLS